MSVLVIAAHPDDEVLGCGGTIARLASEGHPVHVAILGEGITGRFADRNDANRAELEALHARSREVGGILGATEVHNFELPDNRFDTVPLLEITHMIEELIRTIRPGAVFTQHGGDLNIDHVRTYRATLTATRPMAGSSVREVYAYEVASSSEWSFGQFAPAFEPDVFYNIGDTLERKIQAMQAYESEARAFPHPRSPEALRAQAVRWGATVGVPAAEAFQTVRAIR